MPGSSCLGVKFTTGALDQALSVGAFQRIPFEALSVDVFDESLRLDVCLAHNTTHFPRGSMCGRMRRGGLIHSVPLTTGRLLMITGLFSSRVLAVCDGRRSHEVGGLVMMLVERWEKGAGPNDGLVLEIRMPSYSKG